MKLQSIIDMPKLHIHARVEKNGVILHDEYQHGHSWVRNAYHYWNLAQLDSLSTTDLFLVNTGGFLKIGYPSSRSSTFAGYGFYNNINTVDYGIQVGTGTTSFHLDDYRLEAHITHGNSANQLYYQAQTAPVTTYTGDPDYTENILHKRVFNNNSGASITVREVGLVYHSPSVAYFLMSRDVLETPVVVANGAQLTITVSITTQSLSDIDPGIPALGALGSGGIYIGQFDYAYDTEAPGSHRKYGIILSPKTGGESTALAWRVPAASTTGTSSYYGKTGTDILVALGASSPIGQFCAAANAAVLGGYSDWYIPGHYEMSLLYTNMAYIPSGEELGNEEYWTSTQYSGSYAYCRNPVTNSESASNQTNACKVRLIRRFLISSWTPDE